MRLNKSFFITGILFLLLSEQALAFLSPGNLTLIAGAVGSFIWGILVIVAVNIFLFFKKTKKKIKPFFIILSLIFFFVIILSVSQRYIALKNINQYSTGNAVLEYKTWKDYLNQFAQNENQENLRGRDLKDFVKDNVPETLPNLKKINLEEAIYNGSYKIFSVYRSRKGFREDVPVSASRFTDLSHDPANDEFFDYLMYVYNISKNDKIVLFCDAGFTAKTIAFIFAFRGYDVFYATMRDIKDRSLLEEPSEDEKELFIDILNKGNDEKHILFIFTEEDANIIDDKELLELTDNNIIFIDVNNLNLKLGSNQPLTNNISHEKIMASKIICINEVHCFKTINYLGYLNETDIEKVYLYDAD